MGEWLQGWKVEVLDLLGGQYVRKTEALRKVALLYFQLTQLTENMVPKAFLPLRPGAAAVPMQTPAQFPVTYRGIKRCVLKV